MKKVSPYLKMKVLGALEFAEGETDVQRYKAVSKHIFKDEEGVPFQFTWRTIQTWWYYYRRHGITEPVSSTKANKPRKISEQELLEVIEKVKPHFKDINKNTAAIYRKCIEMGYLKRSQIAETTFRRHIKRFDLLKNDSEVTSKKRKAFAKANINEMWQCDTMHGPTLSFNGKKQKTFLIGFIDDASRFLVHGEFYTNDNTPSLIDCFQNAIFTCGIPRTMYVDNGSNYSSKEISRACLRLGIILIHTPVRDGAAKGKIERFFKTVRAQFLNRNLSTINTLEELNNAFREWVSEYHHHWHSSLDMSPSDRFGIDLQKIQWLNPSPFNKEIFFAEKEASVRTDNTFQHKNIRWEAPHHLGKTKIQIRYNAHDPAQPPIVYKDGMRLGTATKLDLIQNDRKPSQQSH